MTTPELYVPQTEHGIQIANIEHVDPVQVICTEFDEMYSTLCGIEFALGLRFDTDRDEYGLPLVAVNSETWDLIDSERIKKSSTKPRELIVTVTGLDGDSANAHIVLPLPVVGHRDKAVTAVCEYNAKQFKRGKAETKVKLGRKILEGVRVRANPFYRHPIPTCGFAIKPPTHKTFLSQGILGTR